MERTVGIGSGQAGKAPITKEQVEAAKRSRDHPVVEAIDRMGVAYWKSLSEGAKAAGADEHVFIDSGLIPFSQSIDGREFKMGALDIVSIGSKLIEAAPGDESLHIRYRVFTAVAMVFCSQEARTEEWAQVFERTVEDRGYIRYMLNKDGVYGPIFERRALSIVEGMDELGRYMNGDLSELFSKVHAGDRAAINELLEKSRREELPRDDVLSELCENINNGMCAVVGELRRK